MRVKKFVYCDNALYIHTGMGGSSFYIGATDLEEEGVWLWLNGENVEMGLPFWGGVSQLKSAWDSNLIHLDGQLK